MHLLTLLLFIDLTRSVVSGPGTKAVTMLLEEVEKRTAVHWTRGDSAAKIVIKQTNAGPAEGYSINVQRGVVNVNGNDARGVLFGVGYLLRHLRIAREQVTVPDGIRVPTAPKYPLRRPQRGHRPKTQYYDARHGPAGDQYQREPAR